jgi:Cytochrome P460
MTSLTKTAAVTAGALLAVAAAGAGTAPPAGIPAPLAGYREWEKLLKEPLPVPYELAVLCAAPTPRQVEEAKRRHGPHNDYLIEVYANPAAQAVLQDGQAPPALPAGAVIAKEKLRFLKPGTMEVDGVAFMVKHDGAAFRESGGWEFLFFPKGNPRHTQQACARCHRSAKRDYVFGSYLAP